MVLKLPSLFAAALIAISSLVADTETRPEEIDLPNLITLALQRDYQIRVVAIDKQVSAESVKRASSYWDPALRASHSSGALGGGGGASSSFNSQQGDVTSASISANTPTGGRLT